MSTLTISEAENRKAASLQQSSRKQVAHPSKSASVQNLSSSLGVSSGWKRPSPKSKHISNHSSAPPASDDQDVPARDDKTKRRVLGLHSVRALNLRNTKA